MNNNLDPLTAITALLSVIIAPAVAAVLAPYTLIVMAATTGAAWALGSREPSSRFAAAVFFTRLNLTAILVTVSLAESARSLGVSIDVRWLLAPIALVIGGIGDNWPHVGKFLVNRVGRLIDTAIFVYKAVKTGNRNEQPEPPVYRKRNDSFINARRSNDGDDQ